MTGLTTEWRPETGILGPAAETPEWFAQRSFDPSREPPVVLGASEASVIAGLSQYKTPLELYYEKRGLRPGKEANEAMIWGQYLQPAILGRYQELMGCRVSEFPYMIHLKDRPYIVATPDGIGWEDNSEDQPWAIEIKNCSGFRYDKKHGRERNCFGEGQDDVPFDYVMQAQQQMLVTGLESCDLPVLFDGRKLRLYCVLSNKELMDTLVKTLEEFYQRVVNGDPPEPDFTQESTLEMIKDIFPVTSREVQLTAEMAESVEKYQRSQGKIKHYESQKKEAQAELLYAMQDAAVAHIVGSPYKLQRTAVPESMWAQEDIKKAQEKLGSVKRRGYTRFSIREEK